MVKLNKMWYWLCGGLLGLISVPVMAAKQLNLTPGVTPISQDQYNLHMLIFWVCVVIGALVFSVMIYSIIKHRKSKGAKPADFHEHTSLELLWAVVPFIILVAMAIPATRVLMRMEDTRDAAVTIKVTGYQWKWQYEYLNQGINYFSNLSTPPEQINNKARKNKWYLLQVDNPLVVPVNKKIRFLVTAADVIHSWWVPAFGIKRDAVPGFVYEAWAIVDKPGTYRGQCAELCGVNHGYMPIVVKAVSEKNFEKWVKDKQAAQKAEEAAAGKTWTKEKLMERGKEVYLRSCAACHKADGTGMGTVFPGLKGSSVALGPINRHIEIILNGRPGTAMQAFAAQLSDAEIAAVTTYERNAWGNDTGDVVQPAAVKAEREGQAKTKPNT